MGIDEITELQNKQSKQNGQGLFFSQGRQRPYNAKCAALYKHKGITANNRILYGCIKLSKDLLGKI